MKSPEKFFRDWEQHAFGYGYGTGEGHVLPALKTFLDLVDRQGRYDYNILEARLTPAVAWLLINALCKADVIDYGTSPRYGFLSIKGKALKKFVDSRSADQLIEATLVDDDYVGCMPDVCNCGPTGYMAGRTCPNPFFHDEFAKAAAF